MKKLYQSIVSTVGCLIFLLIVFGLGYYLGTQKVVESKAIEKVSNDFDLKLPTEVIKRTVTLLEVEAKIGEIAELSTYLGEYSVTKSADYQRYLLDDIPILGTKNSITIECSGIVKVGYDVNDVVPTIDTKSMKIYIALPEVEVLDNYIIWDTVKCIEDNNILNPIEFEQYQDLFEEIEVLGLQYVEEDGIYEAAQVNVEKIIRNFLSGFYEYEVVFI